MIATKLIRTYFPINSLQIHCIGLFGPRDFQLLGLGFKLCPYNWRRLWEILVL